MPVQFLSSAERDSLSRFPTAISPEELITYFTLTEEDIQQVEQQRRPVNRLGYALQFCSVAIWDLFPLTCNPRPKK